MANQRKAGQTFTGFQADAQLIAAVDKARARERKDRSLWFREAVAEKLRRMGFVIPDDWIFPPIREVLDVTLNETTTTEPVRSRSEVVYPPARQRTGARMRTMKPTPEDKRCALSNNCPEACPILDRFDVRNPKS